MTNKFLKTILVSLAFIFSAAVSAEGISTHVLDLASGVGGKNVPVVLELKDKAGAWTKVANEISQMLSSSSQKVESIVNNTKEKVSALVEVGKEKVDTGNEVANQCALVLKDIVEKVNSVTSMTNEVTVSFNEQKEGFSQIAKSILAMDKITQQNSMLAKENAQTMTKLNQQTVEMKNAYADLSNLLGKK